LGFSAMKGSFLPSPLIELLLLQRMFSF